MRLSSISLYSVRTRENTDQNNFEYGQFSRSVNVTVVNNVDRNKLVNAMKTSNSENPFQK